MIDLDKLERKRAAAMKAGNTSVPWVQFITAMCDNAPELIAMARAGLKLRALVANDAYAITFQHSGHYRTALLKAFDAAMEQKP